MKKAILALSILVLLMIAAYIATDVARVHSLHETYIDRAIRSYARIYRYKIIQKVHDDYQWYCKVSIDETDGQRLLGLYPFKHGYNTKVLGSKMDNNYVKDCSDCWYYLDDKRHGVYGYVLYSLKGNKKQLEIYEEFGD